jgi:hypothetical protein
MPDLSHLGSGECSRGPDGGYFERAAIPAASSIFLVCQFSAALSGLISFGLITQGGAHFTSLALGYNLSGFPPSSDFGAASQPS